MKISTSPQFPLRTLDQKPPSQETPAQKPDQIQLSGDENPNPEPPKGIRWSNVAVAGGFVAAGAAVGAAAGMYGGLPAELVALGSVPGLALAGGLIGGVVAEKFGPSSSEYRAIGGLMIGGLVGAGAGLAQAFLVSGGGPVAATTLGISGGLMGLAGLFKLATSDKE